MLLKHQVKQLIRRRNPCGTMLMQTHNAKQDALEAIQRLPDSMDMEEIVYGLHVLSKIQ